MRRIAPKATVARMIIVRIPTYFRKSPDTSSCRANEAPQLNFGWARLGGLLLVLQALLGRVQLSAKLKGIDRRDPHRHLGRRTRRIRYEHTPKRRYIAVIPTHRDRDVPLGRLRPVGWVEAEPAAV